MSKGTAICVLVLFVLLMVWFSGILAPMRPG
jgi:hypothetical protein